MPTSGFSRNLPRRQKTPIAEKYDNYKDNNRYRGDPNLTDETDIFDSLYKQDKIRNAELHKEQSIQKWSDQ